MIGQTLGPYKIMEQIGSGGMATVYKAYHATMDRFVAIKVLPVEMARDPSFTARFAQEARTIAKLEHPFILPVYDSGKDQGIYYIVMRYMEAGTLGDLLNKGTPDYRTSARLIQRIAEALDYAHSQGIVHRDIKPNNILIDKNGQPYLTDFGIAKIVEGSLNLTGSAIIGTPSYMSPEQGQGIPVDNRSDIYSLGVMLYEMVTGRRPFDGDTPMSVLIKHMQEPLPPPSKFAKNIPPKLEQVIIKSLEKDRNDRYATAADFARALEEAITGVAPVQAAPVAPAAVTLPPVSRPGSGTASARPNSTRREPPVAPPPPQVAEQEEKDNSGRNWFLLLGCGGLGLLAVVVLAIGAIFVVPGLLPGSGNNNAAATATAYFLNQYTSALGTANALSTANANNLTVQPAPSPVSITQPADATLPPPTATIPAPTETPGTAGCNDNAKFVADVTVPDNSPISPNTPFVKTWRVQNTGTCNWTTSYTLKFTGGVQMTGPGAVNFPASAVPGDTLDISVNLVAPAVPGTYTGNWRLANGDGALFGTNGNNLTVVIVVPATSTPTLAPSITPTTGFVILVPSAVFSLASPATLNPSSVGSLYSNGDSDPALTVGDNSGDISIQGFATFKLTGLPNNATITGARPDLSNYTTDPGPTGNAFSLGCLRIYQQNYGDLDTSDFFTGGASGALWRFCDASQLSDEGIQKMDSAGVSVLQASLPSGQFQVRFQFNEQTTNHNHVPDILGLSPKLIVTFTTP